MAFCIVAVSLTVSGDNTAVDILETNAGVVDGADNIASGTAFVFGAQQGANDAFFDEIGVANNPSASFTEDNSDVRGAVTRSYSAGSPADLRLAIDKTGESFDAGVIW